MKPAWLDKKINFRDCVKTKQLLRNLNLSTVCEQALCPNIAECFGAQVATFLILGRHCTRHCSFCNISKAKPLPVDPEEPLRVAQAAAKLGLKHVVVTSVTRDDLPDGGASIFAATVKQIKQKLPQATIEILIPDFRGLPEALAIVVSSGPQVIAHNLETVPVLYKIVRQGAEFERSLNVLHKVKAMAPQLKVKTGLMLGLGEKPQEVLEVLRQLRRIPCDLLSIGQYLAPTQKHYPVKEYILPEVFRDYKEKALALGFQHVESAPYVRSSYLAGS